MLYHITYYIDDEAPSTVAFKTPKRNADTVCEAFRSSFPKGWHDFTVTRIDWVRLKTLGNITTAVVVDTLLG